MSVNLTNNTSIIKEDLVHVNRVTKVVKGGRNFSFAVLVVVGDENGKVGYGSGKAKEVMGARMKAVKDAKKNTRSQHKIMFRSPRSWSWSPRNTNLENGKVRFVLVLRHGC